MNRLFNTLRRIVEGARPDAASPALPALPDFEERVDELFRYSEQAAAYEDDLTGYAQQLRVRLDQFADRINRAIDAGRDRDAFELVRLAARIRPQYDLVNQEMHMFHAVAADLIERVNRLIEHLDEARALARDGRLNPTATRQLDETLKRLVRYFELLERVSTARRQALPGRLAEKLTAVIDDRHLDLQLARYVLARRRALGPGKSES